MFSKVPHEVKHEEGSGTPGPLEHAYQSVQFREIPAAEFLSCAFAGLAADRQFTLSNNAYKLPEMDPSKTKYVHVGGFYDGKSDPKPGEYFNGGVYDSDRLLFDEDGRPREIDLRKLSESGTGLTQTANTVVLHIPFEIDDDVDGKPVPLIEQCRFIDRFMIGKWGFPLPNTVTLSGDDREWATGDKFAHVGKSVHAGFAVLPSSDFELREKVAHALAVITGGDPAVADRCRRMRLGGCKTRWAGSFDCMRDRYQTALQMHRSPTTLENLWTCCQRAADDLGIADTEKAYKARLTAKAMVETSRQCLEVAQELWSLFVRTGQDAVQCLVLDLNGAGVRLSEAGRRVRRSLQQCGSDEEELQAGRRRLQQAREVLRGANASSGAADSPQEELPVNLTPKEFVAPACDTSADRWSRSDTVWEAMHAGVRVSGTCDELMAKYAGPDRKVTAVHCPYCDKKDRWSGFLWWSRSGRTPYFRCSKCMETWWADNGVRSGGTTARSPNGNSERDGRRRSSSNRKGKGSTVPARATPQNLLRNLVPDCRTVNARYLTNEVAQFDTLKKSVIYVCSPKGTGKTTLIDGLLAANPGLRVLHVTHRRGLVDQHVHRNPDFLDYRKLKATCRKDPPAARESVVINSIRDVSLVRPMADGGDDFNSYDLVILDEVEQLLQQFVGDTIESPEPILHHLAELLCACVRNGGRILALDADLSPLSVNILRLLLGRDHEEDRSEALLLNEWRAQRTWKIAKYLATIDAHVKSSLMQGQTLAIHATSLREARRVEKFVRQTLAEVRPAWADQVLCINSSTSEKLSDCLADINGYLAEHPVKVMIYTGSIGTGVSIDLPEYFDRVVLYAQAGDFVTAADVDQAANRVRHPRDPDVLCWVNSKGANLETDPERIKEDIRRLKDSDVKLSLRRLERGAWGLWATDVDPLALEVVAQVKAFRRRSENDLRGELEALLVANGVKIRKLADVSKVVAKPLVELRKQHRAGVDTEDARLVVDAEVIPFTGAKELARRDHTQAEEHAIRRAFLVEALGLDAPDVQEVIRLTAGLVQDYERGGLREHVRSLAWQQVIVQGGVGKLAIKELDRHDRRGVKATPDLLRAERVAGILGLYGITGPITSGTRLSWPPTEALDQLEAQAGEIQRECGVKVPKDLHSRPFRFLRTVIERLGLKGEPITERRPDRDAHGVLRRDRNGDITYTERTVGYKLDGPTTARMLLLTRHMVDKLLDPDTPCHWLAEYHMPEPITPTAPEIGALKIGGAP